MSTGGDAPPMGVSLPKRYAAACGFAGVVVWVALYAVAALAYAGYDPVRNYLSDLGHPAAAGNWAFNGGAVAAGLLFLPFAIGVGQVLRSHVGWAGSLLLFLAATSLILVGLLPEESPNNMHFLVSAAFFLLLTLGAAVLAIPLHRSKDFGAVSGLLSGATVAGGIAFLASGGQPLPEHIAVFVGLAWSIWNAGRMFGDPAT